jgi:hypothetical protein
MCNNLVKRKTCFFDVKVLNKHAYGNIQMPYQSILQLGLHKIQSGKGSFIFHTSNDLNTGKFNKSHELRDTNHQQIVCGKLMPQLRQWIFISKFYHGLRSLIFHGNVKRKFYKSKMSFESGSKTHLPLVPTYLDVQ